MEVECMKNSLRVIITIIAILVSVALISSISLAATTTINSDGPSSGKDAYSIFESYLGSDPIDGPDADHIIEVTSSPVGNAFEFILHNTGDYDGSNTDRQRNEIKVYGSSPDNLKATNGSTFTYKWKFKLASNYPAHESFCHIFQLKAYGGDDGAPILTFTTDRSNLLFRHSPIGATMDEVVILASTSLSNVKGIWVEANVTVKNTDSGSISMTLKKLDGTTLMSYSGTKDNWRTGAEFNRPKWGIYRGIYDGMTEARIQFANFQIIDGVSTPTPTPTPTPGGNFSGYYKITARHSGKAATVASASTADSANIFQYTYGGSDTNDEWQIADIGSGYYKILARHSGKAMTVQSASTADGANVFQYTYGGSATNDEWQIVDLGGGYYRIVNRNSGKALEVVGSSTSNSANIQQMTWNGGNNQQWQIVSIP